MNGQLKEKPIKDQILEKIKHGNVKMRPRWKFILQAVLLAVGIVLVLLVLLYFFSFTIFTLRETGAWFVPFLGPQWLPIVFRSLPWIIILLSAFFVVVLEILFRHYSFAYRKPFIYSLILILVIMTIGGSLFAPFHRGILKSARMGGFPAVEPFYRRFGPHRMDEAGVYKGEFLAPVPPNGFIIEDVFGGTSTVIINPRTAFPSGSDFEQEESVLIYGRRMDNIIRADRVERISE